MYARISHLRACVSTSLRVGSVFCLVSQMPCTGSAHSPFGPSPAPGCVPDGDTQEPCYTHSSMAFGADNLDDCPDATPSERCSARARPPRPPPSPHLEVLLRTYVRHDGITRPSSLKGHCEGSVNPFLCAASAHTSSVRHTLPKFRGCTSSGLATRAASRPWAGTTLVAFTYGPLRTPDLDDDGGHDVTLPALPWARWDLGARHARDGLDAIRHREVPIRGEISPDSYLLLRN